MNGKLHENLQVKNTFIDVPGNPEDDDVSAAVSISKRQCSEPAPTRQFSLRQTSSENPMSLLAESRVLEEALDEDDELEDKGLEAGEQPRQDTGEGLGSNSPLNRQVTELNWPTWGQMPMAPMPMTGLEGLVPSGDWRPPYGFPGVCDPASLQESEALQGQWPQAILPGSSPALALVAQQAAQKPESETGGEEVPTEWKSKTTVMLRNLPNKYNQQMLLEELNSSGFLGTFDFLYLPIDPETNANRGYCFINFTDPSCAWTLKLTYEGRKMGRFNSDKVVSVAPAALQGFEANYAHYSTARVNRGDPSTRPLFLREAAASGQEAPPRRRGGRRSQGSLIDIAARQQKKTQGQGAFPEGYIGLQPGGAMTGPQMSALPTMPEGKKGGKASGKGGRAGRGGGQESQQVSEALPRPRFCPFCGGEAKPDFRFCQFCGASLSFGGDA